MTLWRSVSRWATASHERALANARVGAVEASRLRLERAEVEDFLLALAADRDEVGAAAVEVTTATAARR